MMIKTLGPPNLARAGPGAAWEGQKPKKQAIFKENGLTNRQSKAQCVLLVVIMQDTTF